jgi:hypothetical protein
MGQCENEPPFRGAGGQNKMRMTVSGGQNNIIITIAGGHNNMIMAIAWGQNKGGINSHLEGLGIEEP